MAEPNLKPEQVARETIRPHFVAQIAPGQCGSLERWLGIGSGSGWALLGSVLGSPLELVEFFTKGFAGFQLLLVEGQLDDNRAFAKDRRAVHYCMQPR